MLPDEAARANRSGRNLTFVMIDIAGLAGVNSRLGDELGDELLVEFSKLMKTVFRGGDFVFRVLCKNLTEPAILAGLAFPAKPGTVAVVAVEMWKPAFGAGFQAPWDGQQSSARISAIGPTERHLHSEPLILTNKTVSRRN